MAWIANSLVVGMTAQYSSSSSVDLQIINGWSADLCTPLEGLLEYRGTLGIL